MCNYSQTSENGPTLNGPLRLAGWFVELEYHYNGIVWVIIWEPNKVIDIGKRSTCRDGQLERFDCSYYKQIGHTKQT